MRRPNNPETSPCGDSCRNGLRGDEGMTVTPFGRSERDVEAAWWVGKRGMTEGIIDILGIGP